MEEKKQVVNVSSGAKKVENIEKATRAEGKTTAKTRTAKKSPKAPQKKTERAKQAKTRAEIAEKKENAAAEKRVALAKAKAAKKEKKLMHRAELKQKKLEKRAALKEKKLARKTQMQAKRMERKSKADERKAALKAKRAERRAEKIARRETLKHESAAQKKRRIEREKKEKLALRRQKQEAHERAMAEKRKAREQARARRSQQKRQKNENKKERRQHAPGFGGWLAATITLGVATLALATVVTAGMFRMNDMDMASTNSFRATLYEMVSVTEDMDGNLNKLRVSDGIGEQRTLLTNVLVDSALLESALERCPVDSATATDISAFVNKTNLYAKMMLKKLASGNKLSAQEHATLNYLYQINSVIYHELNELSMTMTESEMKDFLRGKQGSVGERFQRISQSTLQEPEEGVEVPFANVGNVGKNQLAKMQEIDVSHAEALVKNYFNGYRVKTVTYTGETVARSVGCYNFSLMDENDVEIFAQISKNGGKLVFFETYAPCTQKNFDLAACDAIAREYLANLGISDVEAVWYSESGTAADIQYVSVVNGVRAYPDMIRIRVCEEKGRAVAMDCAGYLMNRTEREQSAKLSRSEAQELLSDVLTVNGGALALVPIEGNELLAYEFHCTYDEEEFIVYVDANTGEEVQVFFVENGIQGRFLR